MARQFTKFASFRTGSIYGRRGIFQVPSVARLNVCSDYEAVHAGAGRAGLNVLKGDGRVIQR